MQDQRAGDDDDGGAAGGADPRQPSREAEILERLQAVTSELQAHGAASASAVVPAGETVTLSIVFSWHFPDRNYKASNDHSTDGLILGVSLPPSPVQAQPPGCKV